MVKQLRHGRLGRLIGASALLVRRGCRQDMHDQPKYQPPATSSTFFADGQAARPLVARHRRARAPERRHAALHRQGATATTPTLFPFPITEPVMARGQERFDIYCSPCHGRTGDGDGMVVRRGYRRPPSFTTSGCARRRSAISST